MTRAAKVSLGQFLSELLASAAGSSHRELAERAGMSPAELSKILSGERKRPNPQALRRLAEVLSVPPPYLLYLGDILTELEWRQLDPNRAHSAREETDPYFPSGLSAYEWTIVSRLRRIRSEETRDALAKLVHALASAGERGDA